MRRALSAALGMQCQSVLGRRFAMNLLEHVVEVTAIVESAVRRDLLHAQPARFQEPARLTKTHFVGDANQSDAAGVLLENAAQMLRRYSELGGNHLASQTSLA